MNMIKFFLKIKKLHYSPFDIIVGVRTILDNRFISSISFFFFLVSSSILSCSSSFSSSEDDKGLRSDFSMILSSFSDEDDEVMTQRDLVSHNVLLVRKKKKIYKSNS